MAAKTGAPSKGLRLTLGGAPATPHFIDGVPGLYCPHRATPVGGDGELTLQEAECLHGDPTIPLELIDIPAGELDAAREAVADALREAQTGVAQARRDGVDSHELTVAEKQIKNIHAAQAASDQPAVAGDKED